LNHGEHEEKLKNKEGRRKQFTVDSPQSTEKKQETEGKKQ
jgi:hypothetical protein